MTQEQIKEMEDKAMTSLYNALVVENKISTVQGMCDVLKAVHEYQADHYATIANIEGVDRL